MKPGTSYQIAQLTNHAGYAALVDLFKADLAGVEKLMERQSNTREEDEKHLARWKTLREFVRKMESEPARCDAEIASETKL